MSFSPGFITLKTAFQLTPIILVDGIAKFMPGNIIPIIYLTEGVNFLISVANGAINPELDGFFANYQVMPGGQLIHTQPATYPSAIQVQAANAQVAQPKSFSVRMICPASGSNGGYFFKFAIMQSLQSSLDQHNNLGGTYTIVTPSFIYQNCLMIRMTDVSAGETSQVQYAWQMDFFQPLLSESAITSSLGSLLQSFTTGSQPSSTGLSWNLGGLGVANPGNIFQTGARITGNGPLFPGFS